MAILGAPAPTPERLVQDASKNSGPSSASKAADMRDYPYWMGAPDQPGVRFEPRDTNSGVLSRDLRGPIMSPIVTMGDHFKRGWEAMKPGRDKILYAQAAGAIALLATPFRALEEVGIGLVKHGRNVDFNHRSWFARARGHAWSGAGHVLRWPGRILAAPARRLQAVADRRNIR